MAVLPMLILTVITTTGGKMKKLFLAISVVIAFVSQAKAFNDDFINFGDAQYNIYNDNRHIKNHKTVVKKYYKTVVKEVAVPVAVSSPPQVNVQVNVNNTPQGQVVPLGIPAQAVPLPPCRMQRAEAIVDAWGRVVDYTYVRICY
jgi:hypothetical protein